MLVNVLTTDRSVHADDSEARVDWRDRSLSRCARELRLCLRSLIECYNFSDMPQTVTQALATMAPASAAASLSATEAAASRLASSLSR